MGTLCICPHYGDLIATIIPSDFRHRFRAHLADYAYRAPYPCMATMGMPKHFGLIDIHQDGPPPPSFEQPSPHASPATPGSPPNSANFEGGYCLRRHTIGSALPFAALLWFHLTMLHPSTLYVMAYGFASRWFGHLRSTEPLCRPASAGAVTCPALGLAAWSLAPTTLRLSFVVVHFQRRTVWDSHANVQPSLCS